MYVGDPPSPRELAASHVSSLFSFLNELGIDAILDQRVKAVLIGIRSEHRRLLVNNRREPAPLVLFQTKDSLRRVAAVANTAVVTELCEIAAALGTARAFESNLLAKRTLAREAAVQTAVAHTVGGDGAAERGVVIVAHHANRLVAAAAVARVGGAVGLAEEHAVGVHVQVR